MSAAFDLITRERTELLSTATAAQIRALACQNGFDNWATAPLTSLVGQLMQLDWLVHERE